MKDRDIAKNSMLLHSEAKVEFFKKYLQRYLRIVYLSHHIAEVNIFDVFCGTGIYDNGKKGSPIVAFESIVSIRSEYDSEKLINLVVNDSKSEKIEIVRKYIDERNKGYCFVEYNSLPAEKMFAEIDGRIASQIRNVRNIIFIDPYGYKEIKKSTLENLLENNRTEIIMFLPISQMQRFTAVAVAGELKAYEPLRDFVYGFFFADHPIRQQTVSALEYIDFVKEALRFNQFFTTSYYIERDESNYYALFFISPHIYGFEKILEVKWQLDEESGRGFRQPEAQLSFFDRENKELQKHENYQRLESLLLTFLTSPKTNQEIYEAVLRSEFLPKHATEVFRNWQNEKPNFQVVDVITEEALRKGTFYITWESYNPIKNKVPKALFRFVG